MNRTNELFVGIDVSESHFDVAYRDSNGQPVRGDMVFPNTPFGIQNLKGTLSATASLLGPHPKIVVGMEATSNFHKGLEKTLYSARPRTMEVHILNPLIIKQFKKMHLKVYKTDKLDAHMIALYLAKMRPQPTQEPVPGQEELKELSRLRRTYQEEITRSKNRLRRLIRIHFPGYKQYLGNKISRKMLVTFSQFGSPDEILARGEFQLAETHIALRHKIGAKFASNLIGLAQDAPLKHLNPGTTAVIKWSAKRILDLLEQSKILEKQISILMEEYFPNHPLNTIPGLGTVSIAAIIGEVGDIDRFDTVEKFIGYIGLYPVVWESGEIKARFKMTSKGNKVLKMTFLVDSAPARLFNPVIREYYDRLRSRGKSKKAAGGAIARKMAILVFTLLKNHEEWNREKALAGMKKAEEMLYTEETNEKKESKRLTEVLPQNVVKATNKRSSCSLVSQGGSMCKR